MKRILSATVLILLVVALVLYGAPWMITLLAGTVAALAAYEYVRILRSRWRSHPNKAREFQQRSEMGA